MRKQSFLLLLILSVLLTGCPAQKSATPPPSNDGAVTPTKQAAPPAAKQPEPATQEAKDAAKLVGDRGGKVELTDQGAVKSITVDDGATLEESDIDLFAKQPDLEKLQITNFRALNDAMVEKLAVLKKMRSLQLTNSNISDASLKIIAESFPNLVELDISSNARLTDAALKEGAKIEKLERLTAIYGAFTEFGVLNISKMANLKFLDIRGNTRIGNGGMPYVANLPALQGLKHLSSAVNDSGMESLSKAKGLETLEIQNFNLTSRSGEFIRRLEKLTSLIIFGCGDFDSSALNAMKGMNLGRLTLRDLPSLDDTGMEAFRELPSLKRLYLYGLSSVSDAGMMNLVYLKDLDTLDIQLISITDKAMESISKLENLKTLSIKATEISDASLDLLLKMPKLENLTITDNASVTPAGLQKLKDAKKFKKLVTEAVVPKR